MRADLKADTFDAIYFLDTDRIARDVAYQTIIIGELIKHGKQIIIKGKDYIHNPESKFTLTVLGAVAELERAKIIERMTRGRMHRLRMGELAAHGVTTYGYDWVKKTSTSPPALVINEEQAAVVRWMFETFASGATINGIIRSLEERGIPTRMGKPLWRRDHLKDMLQNRTYAGTRYYNRITKTKDGPEHDKGAQHHGYIIRDRADWIAVKVPAIVSEQLFEKVQEKLWFIEQRYRQPAMHYLLSGLVECAECGWACASYRRYLKKTLADGTLRVYHKSAYRCNSRATARLHHGKHIERCSSAEIATGILEGKVFEMIQHVMLDPKKLRRWIKDSNQMDDQAIARALVRIAAQIKGVSDRRRKLIDLYAVGQVMEGEYINGNHALDDKLTRLKQEKAELVKDMHGPELDSAVDRSISRFCDSARSQFEKSVDFEAKQQFLAGHIEKVVCGNGKVTLVGSVPLELKPSSEQAQQPSVSALEFRIVGEIDRTNICGKRPKPREEQRMRCDETDASLASTVTHLDHVAV
jgi:site-specific DNA recombinase